MAWQRIGQLGDFGTSRSLAFHEGRGFADGLNGGLDVPLRVKRPDTKSDCAADLGCPKLLVDQGSAVKAGPAGDIMVNVNHRSDIPSAYTVYVKAQDGNVIGEVLLAIQSYPGDGSESIAEHPGKLHLVLVNGVNSFVEDPL
jgi:hypothetical protein